MFVVRPRHILGTPTRVAHELDCQTRFYPNTRRPRVFDYNRDFLMYPVKGEHVRNATADYNAFVSFMEKNKYGQRLALGHGGIPIPGTAGSQRDAARLNGRQFVVRPLRHSRSSGYRVTETASDFREGTEYISALYPKKREYRIIFVFGEPLIVLRKKPNEGVTVEESWGHVNSFFQTINDVPNSKLAATDCISRLSNFAPVRGAHIVAADILFNRKETEPYVVLELNACPSLEIEGNLNRVVEAIRARR